MKTIEKVPLLLVLKSRFRGEKKIKIKKPRIDWYYPLRG
ncbi:hypothetical protein C2W64_04583 [Brevibacillus laterosporus]|nr:hypothetical protein C2W64_04583 [Brevibacillus laterosporus]